MSIKRKNIRYIHFDTIDSTQAWTKKNAEFLVQEELTCVLAEEQTAGAGQFNRKWLSPKGENIYVSFYLTLPKPCLFLADLANILSKSCATVLKSKGFDPVCKWPNDILLAGRKVSGVICDVLDIQGRHGLVMGIGINVNMEEALLDKIDQPATSLRQISGRRWDIHEILTPLIFQLLTDLETRNHYEIGKDFIS